MVMIYARIDPTVFMHQSVFENVRYLDDIDFKETIDEGD